MTTILQLSVWQEKSINEATKERMATNKQTNNVYKLTSSVTKAPLFSVIVAGVAVLC